jgi:hypothetical protein
MKKTLLAMLALGALALPAAPAGASPVRVRCGYEAVSGSGSDTFAGRLYGYGAFVAGDGSLETATVTCTMSVRGVLAYTGTFSGTGLVAGSVPVEFTAQDPREVEICEAADWGTGHYENLCYAYTDDQIPPQELYDLVDTALAPVPDWRGRTCDATRLADSAAPGWFGGLSTDGDGDVYVGAARVWDC